MKLLLDTHAFIWMDRQPDKLPARTYEACRNADNSLFLSVVSVWEMQIKVSLGKLRFSRSLRDVVEAQCSNGVTILPVKLPHLWRLADLPALHNDPFDRLLIAQSLDEDLHLISNDAAVRNYPVQLFWE
ncbi:MAG: type II toxin-antitoxin system VapC family toxin [Sulfuricellaceae bacterium]|jgi:PIN domain nuclease of toxin-antitoxin system